MLTLIKNVDVYAPAHLGVNDILVSFQKILKIGKNIDIGNLEANIYDFEGCAATPGLVDAHVHILGGGGEKGFCSRTEEIKAATLLKAGITTVVGLLGTDGYTRTMPNLLAKCKSLNEEGLTAYCMTGNYSLPVRTMTEDVESDLIFINEILGVGEIALSDHRSSHPSVKDIIQLVSSVRVASMIAGKAGVVNFHIGDEKTALSQLIQLLEETDIPSKHLLPTHINRSADLLNNGIDYSKKYCAPIDFTTSRDNITPLKDKLNPYNCLEKCLSEGVDIENITYSSDGQGSLPVFDEKGCITGYGVGQVASMWENVESSVKINGRCLSEALLPATVNPARIYGMKDKGHLREGKDADIIIADANLKIKSVFALGCKIF